MDRAMGETRKKRCYPVRNDRMQAYQSLRVDHACKQLGIAVTTVADFHSVTLLQEKAKEVENYHLRRLKFFVLNPSDDPDDAVMVSGAVLKSCLSMNRSFSTAGTG